MITFDASPIIDREPASGIADEIKQTDCLDEGIVFFRDVADLSFILEMKTEKGGAQA